MKYSYPLASALTLALGLAAAPAARAQNVGIGTTTPNAAAALDITAAGKGLLIPRLDSATRVAIASPPAGLMVYQTTPRAGFYYYTGAAWVFIPDKARAGDNLGNHSATTDLALNSHNLLLKTPGDTYHALRYSNNYDGPLAYGYGGGALGYTSDGNTVTPALRWTRDNNVSVDLAGANNGTVPDLSFGGAVYAEGIGSARASGSGNLYGLDFYTASIKRLTVGNDGTVSVGVAGTNTGTAPDLAFGGSGTGEGIGSPRSSGNPNQYGLDFYTGFNKRLSITNGGYVGIGTTAPGAPLDVNGSIWSRGTVRVDANDTNGGGLTGNAALYFGTTGSNEGIASKRTSGGNRYGLDFYTNNTNRVSITNGGSMGVGTTTPNSTLQVNGSLAVGVVMNLAGNGAGTKLGDSPSGYVGLLPATNADYYLLPSATACTGRVYYIRNNSQTNAAYLGTEQGYIYEGGKIPNNNGAYTLQASGLTKTITAISDGQNWTVLNNGN